MKARVRSRGSGAPGHGALDGETADRAGATAKAIWSAWSAGARMRSLPWLVRPRSAAEGLQAQRALEPFAGPLSGWKIAATSLAGQRHIGVTEPIPGRLFERFMFADGRMLPAQDLNMGVVEAEFAFRLGADLPEGPRYTRAQVLAVVDTLHLAIEVPESRFERFDRVGPAQLAADDACAGRFVLGPPIDAWRHRDLATQDVHIRIDGVMVATGSGSNVLTDPVEALVWIANAAKAGAALLAGQVISTGTTTIPPPIHPGCEVHADFGDLGTVSARFAAGEPVD